MLDSEKGGGCGWIRSEKHIAIFLIVKLNLVNPRQNILHEFNPTMETVLIEDLTEL